MPLSENKQWQEEITEMGKKMMPYLNRKVFDYDFKIIKAEENGKKILNAFALPGGHVYFTERMWYIMNPDERAAIIAHEMIHCDKRHGIDQMLKSQQRMLWQIPIIIASGGSAAALYGLAMGDALLGQRFSLKAEQEADELGVELMKKAGYNPAGAVTAMKKLLYIEGQTNRYEISSALSTHPDTQKRIDYLTKKALALGSTQQDLEIKVPDDPDSIGKIIRVSSDMKVIHARTKRPLKYREEVIIKKMIWNDKTNKTIALVVGKATVLAPGSNPILIVNADKGVLEVEDIMPGDSIY